MSDTRYISLMTDKSDKSDKSDDYKLNQINALQVQTTHGVLVRSSLSDISDIGRPRTPSADLE